MTLVTTGSAFGNVIEQAEIYIEGAPQLYYGKTAVPYMFNPDTSGFYWQLSGTTANPVYALGCYENVSLSDNLDMNDIRCDTVGNKGMIVRRNYIEVQLTLKSLLPFSNLAPLMNGSQVVAVPSEDTEFFGLGQIDNAQYYKVYMPKVYDEVNGDYISFTLHRCRFVSTGQLSMVYGNTWTLPVTIRAFADTSLPTNQQFATVMRRDPSDGL